jgi:hypothetical protein
MGMGVPIFNILFGFVVGWYIARAVIARTHQLEDIVPKLLPLAVATAAYTFLVMAILWGRWTVVLFDPSTDYVNLGIPLILFDPKASFIGWQVLMIFISPFLQVLSTLFGSYVTLLARLRASRSSGKPPPGSIRNTGNVG